MRTDMNNSDYRNCDFCCKRFYKDEVLHCSLTNEEKTDSDVCKAYDADPIKIETYKRAEVKSIDVSEKNKHNIGVIVGIIVGIIFANILSDADEKLVYTKITTWKSLYKWALHNKQHPILNNLTPMEFANKYILSKIKEDPFCNKIVHMQS